MNSHLFIVHFPVTLIVAGVLIDLTGAAVNDETTRLWGGRFLIAGGFLGFLAFATGGGAKFAGLVSQELDVGLLAQHEQWGSVGAWGLVIMAFIRAVWRNRFDGVHGWVITALGIASAVLVVMITISGTLVRHG